MLKEINSTIDCRVVIYFFLHCVLFLLRSPDITITKWHMPFVCQQLMWAMEETFWKKGRVKFANINLVSNWTAKFQLNELPFKCSRPWLHAFNPEVNLIWSREPRKATTHWLIKRTEGIWGYKGKKTSFKSMEKRITKDRKADTAKQRDKKQQDGEKCYCKV